MQSSFTNSDNLVSALSDWGMISVCGPETLDYLQGKLTIDVINQAPDHAQLGCHCDFKGKTWRVFYSLKSEQQIDLLGPRSSIAGSLAELKKYGVFSKVEFSDSSSQWQIFVGQGPEFTSHMQELFGQLPTEHNQLIRREFGCLISWNTPHQRYMCIVNQSAALELEEALSEFFVDSQWWEQTEIQAGIATIHDKTMSEFVPQMMNLQALDAINFNKGCYMGQEVVARTKYLGKNKRAAFILYSPGEINCAPADTLEMQLGENWRRAGTVLRASHFKQHSYILAVLPNDTTEGQKLRLKEQPEALFTVQALPYSLD